jgi:hypothetical protein
MCPPSSPPYHAACAFMARFGTPPWTSSIGFSSFGMSAGAHFVPHTSAPGIRSNASLIFVKRWST